MFDRAPMLGQVNVVAMGQAGMPGGVSMGPPGGGPSGGPSGGMSVSFHGGFPNRFRNFGFPGFYNYPIYAPPPPPPAPSRMVCRKLEKESEREGTDVFECTPEAPQYSYPGYSAYPVTYVRPYGWY